MVNKANEELKSSKKIIGKLAKLATWTKWNGRHASLILSKIISDVHPRQNSTGPNVLPKTNLSSTLCTLPINPWTNGALLTHIHSSHGSAAGWRGVPHSTGEGLEDKHVKVY